MLQFTTNNSASPKSATDLSARDLNGDGDLDLVVSGLTHPGYSYAHDGFRLRVHRRRERLVRADRDLHHGHRTDRDCRGDFTRDGRLDVATANRSFRVIETACSFNDGADSVSILPGSGNGTFGAATTFALGSQANGGQATVLSDNEANR